MPFIPHTSEEVAAMLDTIGVSNIEDLFDEIPKAIPRADVSALPLGLTEMELARHMQERAAKDARGLCFLGAGAYEHHIPAAVWEVTSRGEYLTAYTPYQAEASQGTLQLLYEYQTMMASLMGLEVSNASLYDGASALAEAVLMAVRLHKSKNISRIAVPDTVHPHYRQTLQTITATQGIELISVAYDRTSGKVNVKDLANVENDLIALVIPQPNFFGVLEEVDALTDWAHEHGANVIGVVNPMAMSLIKPPGQWGKQGADIACGEGQPLGVPLASGGPYYGFLCCKQVYVRQLPGRIVGRTVDSEGKQGFVLTLQAREQHIRRGKATSNICTNQGLLVTASTIYMSIMGPEGLRRVALTSHQRLQYLRDHLRAIPQVEIVFASHLFHEIVVRVPNVNAIVEAASVQQMQPGLSLAAYYPELGQALLICVTETKTEADIDQLVQCIQQALQSTKGQSAVLTENHS